MIRAVREFNCAYGPRREIHLAEDSHHPVRLSIEQMPDGIGARGTAFTPTLSIEYLGHRKDAS